MTLPLVAEFKTSDKFFLFCTHRFVGSHSLNAAMPSSRHNELLVHPTLEQTSCTGYSKRVICLVYVNSSLGTKFFNCFVQCFVASRSVCVPDVSSLFLQWCEIECIVLTVFWTVFEIFFK